MTYCRAKYNEPLCLTCIRKTTDSKVAQFSIVPIQNGKCSQYLNVTPEQKPFHLAFTKRKAGRKPSLTPEQMSEIKSSTLTVTELAKIYNLSKSYLFTLRRKEK